MSTELYLQPEEISLDSIDSEHYEQLQEWYHKILEHELEGLSQMGSCVIHENNHVLIRNQDLGNSFLNRVLDIKMSNDDFVDFLNNLPDSCSVVINPFTKPRDAKDILSEYHFNNFLSSTVVGSTVPVEIKRLSSDFDVETVCMDDLSSFDDMFSLFSTFFLKAGESNEMGYLRLSGNVKRGTHVLARKNNLPVGMVGTIDIGEMSSLYCGIVSPEFRASHILQEMASVLCQEINKKSIKRYYGKSRNRAFLFGLRRMFGFKHLYNEKVFI